ncbi:hypothetical protein BH20ACT2_BH20ACT2_15940 [soil metagenome]
MERVPAHVVTAADRASFKRCRRAWDLGARTRRNLEPRRTPRVDLGAAIAEALEVHRFPGMWAWDRSIVAPLVNAALERAFDRQQDAGASVTAADRRDSARLIEAYAAFAAPLDDFEPVQVSGQAEALLPHPARPGRGLEIDGTEVRYRARLTAVVVDSARRHWLLTDRVATGSWAHPDSLVLDEASVAACWAWQHEHLDVRFCGVIHDELRPDLLDAAEAGVSPCFRRTRIRHHPTEIARMGDRLGAEALAMFATGLALYPTPAAHCETCAFRAPCLAMEAGDEPSAMLEDDYRVHELPAEPEPRLGNPTWSMGRGAAPPTFGRRRRDR